MIEIEKAKINDKLDPIQFLKTKIKEIKLIKTMCPAEIFAYKRIISANGLINTPNNSIGAKAIFMGSGTPGIQKICFQYVFFAVKFVITNVIRARPKVTAMFPVTLIPSGVRPKIFKNHMKKNYVNR